MKKLLATILIASISITTVGCGTSSESGKEKEPEANMEVTTTAIKLNGQEVEIGMDVTEDIIENIGDPLDEIEAPSCHYDGNDTIYAYEDFTLYVYQNGEENILYITELTTEKVETPEGAKVGMTKDEIIEIYGEEYIEEGVILSYEEEDYNIDFTIDESGIVTLIELLEK